MYQFELDAIAKRAAERIQKAGNSHADFLKITREEVGKSGITNKSDLANNTKRIRQMVSEHSGVARSRCATARKVASKISERIKNGSS